MMNGIDIANWQKGIDLSKVPCDFVICKATGGTGYVSPDFRRQIEQALSAGKLAGAYHFALDGFSGTTPETEAKHFLETVKPYLGKIVLALDWEADAIKLGAGWAKKWLDYVYNETGIRAIVYMSQSVAASSSWAEVAENHPLWMAQYASYEKQFGYNSDPWGAKTCGKWGSSIAIRQYTSMGYLDGWSGRLDLNLAYIDRAEWNRLCGKAAEETPAETEEQTETEAQNDVTVSCTEIAEQVIAGKWGNGASRKEALGEYFYSLVQNEVNRLMGV